MMKSSTMLVLCWGFLMGSNAQPGGPQMISDVWEVARSKNPNPGDGPCPFARTVTATDLPSLLEALDCLEKQLGGKPHDQYLCHAKDVCVDLAGAPAPIVVEGYLHFPDLSGPVQIFSSGERKTLSGGWPGVVNGQISKEGTAIFHQCVMELRLENLELSGGYTEGAGAALFSLGGDTTLDNVVVTNNNAGWRDGGQGGAIAIQDYHADSVLKISNSWFHDNYADDGLDIILCGGTTTLSATRFQDISKCDTWPIPSLLCMHPSSSLDGCKEVGTTGHATQTCYSCEVPTEEALIGEEGFGRLEM